MTTESLLDRWGAGWRGPLLAALLAMIAGLPGVLAVPPLDRDESRFAEASAQMLETGDFVSIHFQAAPRFKKPVGIYWLQAAAVKTLSQVEDRAIWAYRVPSLLGVMLAAGACVWGAAAFLRPGNALVAGALMASSFMLSTEASIAATDAVLCGTTTLAMAALGRLYLAERGGPPAGRRARPLFWGALALAILVKGPIAPMVVALTLAALSLWERRVSWVGRLGWGWGLIVLAAVLGPWALAITVATDGAFWGAAVGSDLAPKLTGEAEGHGAPPGYYLLLAPLLLFPATLLLPAGAVGAWRARGEPAVRFALCWLIPSWLVFEAAPTKLVHYTLPLYGALAWLMARSLEGVGADPPPTDGPRVRAIGAGLVVVVGIVFAIAAPVAMARLGDFSGAAWAFAAGLLFLLAASAGAVLLGRRRAAAAALAASVAGALGHGALVGGVLPSLRPLWLSTAAARDLAGAGASPWQGVVPGPVTVAGYAEPSLVFLLGADTELAGPDEAADAIAEGRPAIVEGRDEAAFRAALTEQGLRAAPIGVVSGLDYSNGRTDILRLYRPPPTK
ncbi:MAG: 4-amino-4-deoxy-L-arabinose transferase [Caulobacteraceae bacterium]|nr:4-amino-4-deoxy-L-arabinose transferase [Caulobacteraceae bacterium]